MSTDWRALRAAIARYVTSRVGDPVLADDLTQETLTRLVTHRDQVRDAERLIGYALRIARNVVVDHHRGSATRGVAPLDTDVPDQLVDEDPELEVLRTSLARWTAAQIGTLSEREREILCRTELQGCTQREVAESLGLPLSTVKSRVQRGRDKLHAALLACCEIELDPRGAITQARVRPQGCNDHPCDPKSNCGNACG